MATWILVRSARSALKSQDLATRCLPSTAAVTCLNQGPWSVARLFSSNVSDLELEKQREALKVTDDKLRALEIAKQREDLKVTDDIANSEAKLHALFLKWLSYNDHHFDVEDEKAFKERFELFKKTARFVNEWNKSGNSSTCTLSRYADMTMKEKASQSWKTYPKKKLPV